MGKMKNKVFYFWVAVIVCCTVLFFWEFPKLLPFLLNHVYDVDNINAENHTMQNYGLVGDSYGIYNALFSAFALFGVIWTLYIQQRDTKRTSLVNRFYKMLDYQEKLIKEMTVYPVSKAKPDTVVQPVSGRKVFVEYKIQLKYLMKAIAEVSENSKLELTEPDVADIAYAVFYYGAATGWKEFMLEYLKDYPETGKLVDNINTVLASPKYRRYFLGRTNQNYLSVYFRNMYNTIKIIDSTKLLTENEKKEYIKILRAQLSNAELYVLFFNLLSRFGKKWIANEYVSKYEIIQNLPSKYCDGYDPKDYFDTIKYESEEKTLSTFHEVMRPREQ